MAYFSCFLRGSIVALLLLSILHILEAEYILKVQVISYANPTGVREDHFCCNSPCNQSCNNYFTFCLRPLHSINDSEMCPLGIYQTGNISSDEIDFPMNENIAVGVPNPLIFRGDRWLGAVELYVLVEDIDHPEAVNNIVAQIFITVNVTPTGIIPESIYRTGHHFIRLAFQLSCEENFYGEDCTIFCVGKNDESGHFTCNNEGRIECLEGFQNPLTNCTECTLAEGCSLVGGFCNDTNRCICKDEYVGANCSYYKDPCNRLSPCQNGAVCNNIISTDSSKVDFRCECLEGNVGRLCDRFVKCNLNPCQNGGTCEVLDDVDGFHCICTSGFQGKHCEQKKFVGAMIGTISAICMLALITILLVLVLAHSVYQWRKHGRESSHDVPTDIANLEQSIESNATNSHSLVSSGTYLLPSASRRYDEIRFKELDERRLSDTFDNPIYNQTSPIKPVKKTIMNDPSKLPASSKFSSTCAVGSTDALLTEDRWKIDSGSEIDDCHYEDIDNIRAAISKLKPTSGPCRNRNESTQFQPVDDEEEVINLSYGSLPNVPDKLCQWQRTTL